MSRLYQKIFHSAAILAKDIVKLDRDQCRKKVVPVNIRKICRHE